MSGFVSQNPRLVGQGNDVAVPFSEPPLFEKVLLRLQLRMHLREDLFVFPRAMALARRVKRGRGFFASLLFLKDLQRCACLGPGNCHSGRFAEAGSSVREEQRALV